MEAINKFLSGLLVLVLILQLQIQAKYGLASSEDLENRYIKFQPRRDGYQQHSVPLNQRPTQFGATPQALYTTSAHSRGLLIMPANNPSQTMIGNSFHPASSSNNQRLSVLPQMDTHSSSPAIVSGVADHQLRAGRDHQLQAVATPRRNNTSASTVAQVPVETSSMGSFLQDNIEMALRQASGDESVFQFSPTIGASEPSLDWSAGQNLQSSHQNSGIKSNEDHQAIDPTKLSPNEHSVPTTEQSNNIAQNEQSSPNLATQTAATNSLDRSQQERDFDGTKSSSNEQQSFNWSASAASPSWDGQQVSNQIFYEGPATVPPTSPADNYYFSSSSSSSERQSEEGERISNSWWAIGIGHEFERASNLTRDDYLDYCSKSELLISAKQKSLCRSHFKIMAIVARGVKLAIDECQSRFTSSRWNCSLTLQNSLETGDDFKPLPIDGAYRQPGTPLVFGEVMRHANRERSFLNAIIAAGLAHAMTKACSQGELPEECACDKRIRSKSAANNKGNRVEWVACSDDIDFGARFSRDFTDYTDFESDTTSMINLHNYEVGRRVFKSATDITCSCQNGENGLCQTKRCWKHLGPFTDIGDELVKRYESATHVQLSSKDPHKLRPVRRGVRRPKRKDLVYIDESPDYCNPNTRLGVPGTQNRRCNATSTGPDSCSLLCCGRGYQMVVEEIEDECNCKFVWCCQVKCDKCKRHITSDICN